MTTNIGGMLQVLRANCDHRSERNQSRRPPRESERGNQNMNSEHQFLASNASPGMHYGAYTGGCRIECVADLVRKRAFQLFEAKGHQPGQELDDWLQAEREVKHHLGL